MHITSFIVELLLVNSAQIEKAKIRFIKQPFAMLFLILPIISNAAIEVAFIEVRDRNGKLVQLEPDGRFAHIAISYHGKWLHSHPYRGVELVDEKELLKIGSIGETTVVSSTKDLDSTLVSALIGRPYDREFSWTNESYYCSELVAKLLDIPPEPMDFSSPIWPKEYQKLNGQLGSSPDDIYRALVI